MVKEIQYKSLFPKLERPAKDLFNQLQASFLKSEYVDQVKYRVKSIHSFSKKSKTMNKDGTFKYNSPVSEIQDQIGIRIVVKYRSNITPATTKILKLFAIVEDRFAEPEDPTSFGYEGKKIICLIPRAMVEKYSLPIDFFEIQICTLFQYAWAEANHDLGYKPAAALTREKKRKMAWAAAQAWGADQIFDEISKKTS
ncbi:MAG: hypothetical protein WC506_06085 [Candidatus Micrarchaeia archaeon]